MDAQSLKDIESALKRIEKYKNAARKKDNVLHNQVNKKYKEIDWSKKWFTIQDISDSLPNTTLGVFRKLREIKKVKCFNLKYYKKSNIENLFLLQELMCQMDDQFWVKEKKYKVKQKYVPYRFNSAYLGDIYICSIPERNIWKMELVTNFLKDKQFIFDKDSPFGKPIKKVRYFIEKCLFDCKVEKWDFNYKRFLSENN